MRRRVVCRRLCQAAFRASNKLHPRFWVRQLVKQLIYGPFVLPKLVTYSCGHMLCTSICAVPMLSCPVLSCPGEIIYSLPSLGPVSDAVRFCIILVGCLVRSSCGHCFACSFFRNTCLPPNSIYIGGTPSEVSHVSHGYELADPL